MKKTIGALLFGLSLFLNTGAQTLDRETDGLKGPVKSVRQSAGSVRQVYGKPVTRESSFVSVTEYDSSGNKIEVREYQRGVLSKRTTYARDEKGNRVSIRHDADGKIVSKSVGSVDKAGKPLQYAEYNQDGELLWRSVYSYDAQGKFLEAVIYNPDGSVKSRTIFKHNEAGQQVGLEVYDANGKLLQKQSQSASETTSTVYGQTPEDTHESTSQSSKTEIEVDSHGNWTRKSVRISTKRGEKVDNAIQLTTREIAYY